MLDGEDGRLVRPLFGELAVAVDERVEPRAVVRADARERHLVVRGEQHAHRVDLQEPDLPDDAPQMRRVGHAGGSRAVEPLGGERDPPRLA